tara:strand:+ start:1193 stop:1630 length:438 start_codon:yes stop_codon:yes gene_type:complete
MPVLKAVNTLMNQPLNEETIENMTKAVELTVNRIVDPSNFKDIYTDLINEYGPCHMLSIDKEFKYGKGKEIIAFGDGGKGTTGKDLKYVKFFYQYNLKKHTVKANDKTYTYSVPKARQLWNDKLNNGYTRFDDITLHLSDPPSET